MRPIHKFSKKIPADKSHAAGQNPDVVRFKEGFEPEIQTSQTVDQVMRIPVSEEPMRRKCTGCENKDLAMKPLRKEKSPLLQRQTEDDGKEQCSGNSNIVNAAIIRISGEIGKSYDMGETAGWWYSPNENLAGSRKKPLSWEIEQGAKSEIPDRNFIVNWGSQFTCNLFIYDVLYAAGLNPPLRSNSHYYSASETYNHEGELKNYFTEVTNRSSVCPGDIYATGGHLEIVGSKINPKGEFEGYGGHSDGAYKESKIASEGEKFFRVNNTSDKENNQEKHAK